MTPAPDGLSIRPATTADAAAMLSIGDSADRLLAQHGYPQILDLPPLAPEAFASFVAENVAWLAALDRRPAGFVVAGQVADAWWLREIAVDPACGGRGIGSALLTTAIDHGRGLGLARMALSTFRHVPFNAPFYARRGFSPLEPDAAPPAWRDQFLREVPPRISATDRILMVLAL